MKWTMNTGDNIRADVSARIQALLDRANRTDPSPFRGMAVHLDHNGRHLEGEFDIPVPPRGTLTIKDIYILISHVQGAGGFRVEVGAAPKPEHIIGASLREIDGEWWPVRIRNPRPNPLTTLALAVRRPEGISVGIGSAGPHGIHPGLVWSILQPWHPGLGPQRPGYHLHRRSVITPGDWARNVWEAWARDSNVITLEDMEIDSIIEGIESMGIKASEMSKHERPEQ